MNVRWITGRKTPERVLERLEFVQRSFLSVSSEAKQIEKNLQQMTHARTSFSGVSGGDTPGSELPALPQEPHSTSEAVPEYHQTDTRRGRLPEHRFWLIGGQNPALSKEERGCLLARLRQLRTEYIAAHRSGMAAIQNQNFAGLTAMIAQGSVILREQDRIINALRRSTLSSASADRRSAHAADRARVLEAPNAPPSCPFCNSPGRPILVKHQNWTKTVSYNCEGCQQMWSLFFPDREQHIDGMQPTQ